MLIDYHMKTGKTITIDLNCHEQGTMEGGFITYTNHQDPHMIAIQVQDVSWVAVHPSRQEYMNPFTFPPPRRRLDPRNLQSPL